MPTNRAQNNSISSPSPSNNPPHYKISQIARLWNVSDDTVRRIFNDEPGVLRIGARRRLAHARAGSRKKYQPGCIVMRIPEPVFRRVEKSLMHRGPQSVAADDPGRELQAS
jgi:hypothetical protein